MARFVVAAVAAIAVGYVTGDVVLAAQTFAFVYGVTGFLDPATKVLGPRLNDLKAPAADYGGISAYLEGTIRLAGHIIWCSDKQEVATTTEQSKGGPGVENTVFTYKMDVLYELADVISDGIRRVFSNGKLVWTQAADATPASIIASDRTTRWEEMRFYSGDPAQLPDPDYEAAVGMGNAPAYRHRTIVFVKGLNLGGSGQLPVLTFEVVVEGQQAFSAPTLFAEVQQGGDNNTDFINVGSAPITEEGFVVPVAQWDSGGVSDAVNWYQVSATGTVELLSARTEPAGATYWMSGTTDLPCYVAPYSAFVRCVHYDESLAAFVTTDFVYSGAVYSFTRFARGEGCFVLGNHLNGAKPQTLVVFSDSGAVVGESPSMGQYVHHMVIRNGKVYALANASQTIFVLDLATMLFDSPITPPANGGTGYSKIVFGDDGEMYIFISDGAVHKRVGATWQFVVSIVATDLNPSQFASTHAVLKGSVYSFTSRVAGPPGKHQLWVASKRLASSVVSLADVVERLTERTGQLSASDIVVTDLVADTVRGMALTQLAPIRSSMEMLGTAFFFDAAEVGEQIITKKRGGVSVRTLTPADLGMSEDGSEEPFPRRKLNDIEFPKQVIVKFANFLADYQPGAEEGDRLVTKSTSNTAVELPLVLTPTEGKRIADVITTDLQTGLTTIGPVSLGTKHLDLIPTDVLTITDRLGRQYRTRVLQIDIVNFRPQLMLSIDDATAVNSSAATDSAYTSSTAITLIGNVDFEVMDLPIMRNADDALGPYIAINKAAKVDKSVNNTSFANLYSAADKTILGTATTILPNFTGGEGFDDFSTVTVDVGAGATLASYTKVEIIEGTAPVYVIGEEVVYAAVATYVSDGVYRLSSFARGQRGTEAKKATHAAGEKVVLMAVSGSGVRKVVDELPELNATRYYRATSIGNLVRPGGRAFVDTGVALKPYAPVDLYVDRAGASPVVRWNRRTRLLNSFLTTTEPPLGESSESYDAELYSAVNALLESATVAVPSWTPATTLVAGQYVKVYQKSTVVGRGYAGQLTI